MIKINSVFVAIILLASCGEKIQVKIELRNDNKSCNDRFSEVDNKYQKNEGKGAYLVNISTGDTYQFTVKITTKIGDSSTDYTTMKIKLSPGDEKRLGCTKYYSGEKYYMKEQVDTRYYLDGSTTVSKSEVLDSTRERTRNLLEIEYICTGQRLIKNEKELRDSKENE